VADATGLLVDFAASAITVCLLLLYVHPGEGIKPIPLFKPKSKSDIP